MSALHDFALHEAGTGERDFGLLLALAAQVRNFYFADTEALRELYGTPELRDATGGRHLHEHHARGHLRIVAALFEPFILESGRIEFCLRRFSREAFKRRDFARTREGARKNRQHDFIYDNCKNYKADYPNDNGFDNH